MNTKSPTVTADIPRSLIELLYLRGASDLDNAGGVPPVDARPPAAAGHPIGEPEWADLWSGEVAKLGAGASPDPSNPVRSRLLAAGVDLDDLRAWVQEVVGGMTTAMMTSALPSATASQSERDLTAGRVIGVIPVKGDLLTIAGPHLLLVSHQLRARTDDYLARLRDLQA